MNEISPWHTPKIDYLLSRIKSSIIPIQQLPVEEIFNKVVTINR